MQIKALNDKAEIIQKRRQSKKIIVGNRQLMRNR